MARIFIDGFESGDQDMWDTSIGATVISSSGLDMDGDYCLELLSNTDSLEKNITATDEMYFALLWRPNTLSNWRDIFSCHKDGTHILTIRWEYPTDRLEAYNGASLATGTATFVEDITYLIEVWFKQADSGGRVVVKVDSVSDIDFTGDTKPGADTQFNQVRLGRVGAYANAYYDNFIMDDAAWIGNTQIQKILPTGAGNSTGWNSSVGNNWDCVDERPASDADYVSINAVDQVDTYAAGNMTGDIDTVKCVQIQSRTESDGAPTPTNLKLVVRSGADYFSSDKSVPATPKSLCNLWESNPADAAAWEEADVNAMEIGIKSAA